MFLRYFLFLAASTLSADWPQAYQSSMTLLNEHKLEEAYEALNPAVNQSGKEHPFLLNERAKLNTYKGDYKEALQDYEAVLKIPKANEVEKIQAYMGRNFCLMMIGKIDQFADSVDTAEKEFPLIETIYEDDKILVAYPTMHLHQTNTFKSVAELFVQTGIIADKKDYESRPSGVIILHKAKK